MSITPLPRHEDAADAAYATAAALYAVI